MRLALAAVLVALILSAAAVVCVSIWSEAHRYFLVSNGEGYIGYVIDRKTGAVTYLNRNKPFYVRGSQK